MCGIVGVYHFDPTRPIDVDLLVEQNESIAHRGPDDGGFYAEAGVGIAHRRLSIIDLKGGFQPMWDAEARVGVVFNGEIYNFRELRKELEGKGHRFHSDSDTEVILHAYRAWGSAAAERLHGMFALAVFDRQRRTLWLARDRLGKKPLYYYRDEHRVIFASELKGILTDRTVPRTIEGSSVLDYFAYNYVPAPKTILAGIHKLPAGYSMLLDGERMVQQRYWDPTFREDSSLELEPVAERLLEEADASVKERMVAEVPLGAFLSGGVDSSLVVALMARASEEPVKTHTIGFEEAAHDERSYASQTAELYKTEHHERVVKAEAASILDDLSWFYDEPFADSSAVPTYHLCRTTREKVTVALSGDGGDESFAGYRRYAFALGEHRVRSMLPAPFRKHVLAPLGRMYPKADFLPRPLRAKATLTNLSVSHDRAYFLSLTQKTYPRFVERDLQRSLRGYDPFHHFERHLKRAPKDPLARLQYVDLKMYLCDDILVKVDRASMAHALEVRVPLLDHEIVEMAGTLPAALKLHDGVSKRALKRAAQKLLPDSVLNRRKMGFTIPLPEWFRGDLRDLTEQTLLHDKGTGLLNRRGVQAMFSEHQRGIGNHATVLWSMLMFERWAARHMSATASDPVRPRPCRPTRRKPPAGVPWPIG